MNSLLALLERNDSGGIQQHCAAMYGTLLYDQIHTYTV